MESLKIKGYKSETVALRYAARKAATEAADALKRRLAQTIDHPRSLDHMAIDIDALEKKLDKLQAETEKIKGHRPYLRAIDKALRQWIQTHAHDAMSETDVSAEVTLLSPADIMLI